MKFFEKLQSSLYDIFGLLIPGYILLIYMYIAIRNSFSSSPGYSIIEAISESNTEFWTNFKLDFTANQLIVIAFAAYLLGHLLKAIGSMICSFFDSLKNGQKKRYHKFIEYIFKKLTLNKSIIDKVTNKTRYDYIDPIKTKVKTLYPSNSNNDELILYHGRALARFEKLDSFIPKYIAKYNFYKSLLPIILLLLVDFYISILLNVFNLIHIKFFSILYCIVILSLVASLFLWIFFEFLSEYYRHKKLCEKECYMLLHNYASKKVTESTPYGSKIFFPGIDILTK